VACISCNDTGVCSKDYAMFACPFCEEGKRALVTFSPISMTATITKIEDDE
jgi:hypothetical protein